MGIEETYICDPQYMVHVPTFNNSSLRECLMTTRNNSRKQTKPEPKRCGCYSNTNSLSYSTLFKEANALKPLSKSHPKKYKKTPNPSPKSLNFVSSHLMPLSQGNVQLSSSFHFWIQFFFDCFYTTQNNKTLKVFHPTWQLK